MAKREITAKKAKENLEAYGYTGNAKWVEIDNFVRLNPESKMALLANKGALVQSKALGFAEGGVVEPSEEDIKKLADLTYLSMKGGVSTEELNKAKKAVGIDPEHNTFKSEDTDAYKPNAVNDLLSKYGYNNNGSPDQFYGTNTSTDPIVQAFVEKGDSEINNSTANLLFAEKVLKEKGLKPDQTIYSTASERGMSEEDLSKAYKESIEIAQNAYGNSGYNPEGQTDILGTGYLATQQPPTPTTPLPTTIPIEPTQQEVEKAQQVFSPDGKVTLPTGYDPQYQTMVAEQFQPTSPVAGVTTAQAQTFGNNQGQQFAKRATDQAQLIQPQTLAEKQAAGQTGKIEQRLFKNPQGMSTYVTGTVGVDGNWNPTTAVPQGYSQAQQMQTGGLAQMNQYISGSGGDYSNLDSFKNYDFSNAPFSFEEWKAQAQKEGAEGQTQSSSQMNQQYGAGAGSFNMAQQPQGSVKEKAIEGATLQKAEEGFKMEGYPSQIASSQPATVTAGDKTYTQEEMAQAQADLTAGAVVNPAGTVAAPAVTNINPDASGTVLSATTGQASGVAPIVTDPAQVGTVATADTPTAVNAQTATTQKAQTGVQGVLDDTSAQTSTGPTQTITGQTQDTTKVSGLDAAQIDQAQTVQGAPTRKLETGELISGSAVDQTKVGEAFGTGEVKAATVKDELTTLMQDFEGGNTPPWAAGAMRNATAQMQARGLGASSMAGQALIQSAMESALPIAMADASNKQQMAMMKAEQRAKFLGMEFDQNFQSKVMNAAKVSEIANMNFNAEQQVALENAKMAQTVDLANLNNKQALVMAEAAQISQLEVQGLSNMQQAQVQNAQNFLQIDMANLNNQQQTEIFKAQTLANTILSDTAAANANEQFNASSEMQVDQFNNTMKSQLNQFNSAQTNAMNQFNAGESNAIQKFNSELQNQRETFNSQMYAQIAQANAKWRQDTETTNTAAANQSNFQYAKDVNGLTNKVIDQIWQRERDLMSFSMQSSETAMDRTLQLIMGDKDLEALRMKLDAEDQAAKGSLFSRFIFGSGVTGGWSGILGK